MRSVQFGCSQPSRETQQQGIPDLLRVVLVMISAQAPAQGQRWTPLSFDMM